MQLHKQVTTININLNDFKLEFFTMKTKYKSHDNTVQQLSHL